MDRIRLTKRLASASKKIVAESQADGIFPGDIGNEERKKNYRKVDEYHTFEQTVNHELPDMRHDWQDNPRDEVGMGIPKKATKTMIVNAATNATKLAYFLLGEKASDQLIEQQARDFMRLGSVRLEAAINRFAETTDLYDEEEEAPAEVEADEEEVVEEEIVEEAPAEVEAAEEEIVEEEIVEEAPAEVEAAEEEAAEEEVVEEEVITEEDIAPETVEAAEEECEGEECEEDFDFGETNAADEDEASFPDELDGIFNDEEDDEEEAVEAVKTAKKFNEKLAKASKKASATDVNELAALWGSDNGVF
jgi:hypothetical protein